MKNLDLLQNHEKSFTISLTFILFIIALFPIRTIAQNRSHNDSLSFGVKIRAGGRYDNLRMCVATPAGVKGGPAADISFLIEFNTKDDKVLSIDIPVFRPILFATSFEMLQFEPSATLKYRKQISSQLDFIVGPSLGISFNYGPDFNSENTGINRTESFFSIGPTIGSYFGIKFNHPEKSCGMELGISPYVTPLFSINNSYNNNGIVIGGLLDLTFSFK